MMQLHKILQLTLPQAVKLFIRENPDITALCHDTVCVSEFREGLAGWIAAKEKMIPHTPHTLDAWQRIRDMLSFADRTEIDLSTDQPIRNDAFGLLWETLRMASETPSETGKSLRKRSAGASAPDTGAGTPAERTPFPVEVDFMVDLIELLRQANGVIYPAATPTQVKRDAARWATGLDPRVMAVRAENKRRIVELLIRKIERRGTANHSRFVFVEGISHEEKRTFVETWWNDSRFHLAMAIRSPRELNRYLNDSLSDETLEILADARRKNIPFFITPYYVSLLDTSESVFDDRTIRSYILYSRELVETYGTIRAWEKEDVVVAGEPNAAGWIVPGHNIHRRYPEVAILIPDSMGRACGGLCAVCQRMYDFQNERFNFELQQLKPNENWAAKLRALMRYFEEDSQLRDILITGGDAFMSQNVTLRNILDTVYKMAVRKRKANLTRPEGGKYAELQRVRLGTRLPAYLPMRINDELIAILRDFRDRASAVGVEQFIIQTHFESPLEMTPEAREGIRRLQSAGWVVTNQLVFTAAASRRGHSLRLRQTLNREGVMPYYTFSVKGFEENYAMFTPNARSMQEREEEKIFGVMDGDAIRELMSILRTPEHLAAQLRMFMRRRGLPFLATDRSVLNLPAIGKSMTFTTVGLTPDGRRILCFDHDHGRKHSPVIGRIGKVYITENKSLAAYLRHIAAMGENVEHYRSVWVYGAGQTEPLFPLFEYPDRDRAITCEITNLGIN